MDSMIPLSKMLPILWMTTKSSVVESVYQNFNEQITVSTKSGLVKGYKTSSHFDYKYFNFIGIPYAKPPIGELRFKDPQPLEPSDGIINEKYCHKSSMAMQSDALRVLGNEDCLHMSCFTRDVKPASLKPVMIWFHGGGFVNGSNAKEMYNPEYLLRNDIVMFSVNFRLGAFGFVTFNDPELGIPGNASLKDQTMAMKWIKENCRHFGGDPNNITLMGQSAGSMAVSLHLVSDLSKNLFHRAVLFSGNIFGLNSTGTKDWTHITARKLGWNGEGGDKACLSVYQKASSEAIIRAQAESAVEATASDAKSDDVIMFPFSPVCEPYESEQCFMRKNPNDLVNSAWSRDIPIIICNTSNEWSLAYAEVKKQMLQNRPQVTELKYLSPFLDLEMNTNDPKCEKMGKKMEKFYFGYTKVNIDTILTLLMVANDKLANHPTHRMILSRLKNRCAPTYMLRFSFESKTRSFNRNMFGLGSNVPGVCHGDDLPFYFRVVYSGEDPPKDSDDWKTIERMCACITSFMKTGNPNNEIIAPVQWEPVALEMTNDGKPKYKCFDMNKQLSFEDSPCLDRMYFWDQMYEDHNKNII